MELKLYFVLLTLGLTSGFEFVIEPKSITALKGEAVMLSCSVTGMSNRGTIFWQRVNTGRYVSLDYVIDPYDIFGKDMKNRYKIIGEPSVGEYTLFINDVRKSDIGRYACLYSEPSGAKTISRHATLSVLIPPGPEFPRCRMEPEGAVVGDEVDLVCESEGGLPPATLTWFRGNEILPGKYGKAGALTENRFRKILSPTDRGVEFICEASGIAIVNTLRTCTIVPLGLDISVQIKPQVKVANEGSRATFTCIAPGDMRDYDVYWSIGDEELHVEDPRISFRDGHPRLRIDPVKMSDHGKIITCIVYDYYYFQGNASSVLFVTKTEITKEPSKNAIIYEIEPASEQPTKISIVASVEGGPHGVFTAPNELPAADQATAGNPDAGVVVLDPSPSPKASEQTGNKETGTPMPSKSTPKADSDNPSMIFTNHFAMPTVDVSTNQTEKPVDRGDAPNEATKSTEIMNTKTITVKPNNLVSEAGTATGVNDSPETNEVEVPEMQSEANENVEELETNELEEKNTDNKETMTNGEVTNNEAGKSNLEGGKNSDKTAKEGEEEENGQKIRIKIICSVITVGVILIAFGFWRFSKSIS